MKFYLLAIVVAIISSLGHTFDKQMCEFSPQLKNLFVACLGGKSFEFKREFDFVGDCFDDSYVDVIEHNCKEKKDASVEQKLRECYHKYSKLPRLPATPVNYQQAMASCYEHCVKCKSRFD